MNNRICFWKNLLFEQSFEDKKNYLIYFLLLSSYHFYYTVVYLCNWFQAACQCICGVKHNASCNTYTVFNIYLLVLVHFCRIRYTFIYYDCVLYAALPHAFNVFALVITRYGVLFLSRAHTFCLFVYSSRQ